MNGYMSVIQIEAETVRMETLLGMYQSYDQSNSASSSSQNKEEETSSSSSSSSSSASSSSSKCFSFTMKAKAEEGEEVSSDEDEGAKWLLTIWREGKFFEIFTFLKIRSLQPHLAVN